MLAKDRAWMRQSIRSVPGALGSTPRSLDRAINFLCCQACIKACGATGCKKPHTAQAIPYAKGLTI